jgi:hypothetical protein
MLPNGNSLNMINLLTIGNTNVTSNEDKIGD